MQHQERERRVENRLFTLSQSYSSLPHTVTDGSSEVATRWRLIFPSPTYLLAAGSKREKKNKTTSKTQLHNTSHGYTSTMGGQLNDNFDYIYEGGLSTRVSGSMTSLSQTDHTHHYPHRVTLRPVILNRSENILNRTKQELARLVELQLKPDIVYDGMVIEQNLRSVDLDRLPTDYSMPKLIRSPQSNSHQSVPIQSMCVAIGQLPSMWRRKDPFVLQRNKKTKKNQPKPFDWSVINQSSAAFKRGRVDQEHVLQTSFSRLLESSSVVFSYKKK